MNKKSKKRAFFVYVVISLIYVSVTFRIPEKMSVKRISDEFVSPSKGTIVPMPDTGDIKAQILAAGQPVAAQAAVDIEQDRHRQKEVQGAADLQQERTGKSVISAASDVEPSLLMAVPIVCFALKEGWVDKEGLIFPKKNGYNNPSWKKPVEILKEHDEEGIRNLGSTIGLKRILEFMKKEGISVSPELNAEQLILGRGYRVEEKKLLELYEKYASFGGRELLRYSVDRMEIRRDADRFRLIRGVEAAKDSSRTVEADWMMPNLENLPIRQAIEKLSDHTFRIKVYGSGFVVNQSPRAFERLRGDQECTIQGRMQSE